MKRSYYFDIPYQDVDAQRRLRLYTLENYLLQVAGKAADEAGFGLQYLMLQGLTWIITRLQLQMQYLPTHGDQLRIDTWVEQNAHMLSTRHFYIYCNDQRVGQATSVWAVLDMQKREIVNVFDQAPFLDSTDAETITWAPARRWTPTTPPTCTQTHTIQYSDVDYNHHCNSCKYLEFMLNTPPSPFAFSLSPIALSLSITYHKELHLADILTTSVWETENGVQFQQKDAFGATCCVAQLTFL